MLFMIMRNGKENILISSCNIFHPTSIAIWKATYLFISHIPSTIQEILAYLQFRSKSS